MRRRVIIAAVAAIAMIAGFWLAAWSPANRHLAKAHSQLAQAQSLQNDLRQSLLTLQAEQKQVPALRVQLTQLQRAVPSTESMDTIFDQLNSLAAQSGVKIPSVAPSVAGTSTGGVVTSHGSTAPTKTASGAQAIQLSINVTGTYSQMLNFINRLNSSPRLFVVDALQVSGGTTMSATIQGRAFYTGGGTTK
jgi:Tfp pilus assembly protein PilO